MNNTKKISALFYIEPWIENKKPWFRHFALRAVFLKLSANIIANGGTSTLVCGQGTNFTINESGWGFENFSSVIILDELRLRSITRNYNEFAEMDRRTPEDLAKKVVEKFPQLNGKNYDLTFIWESQANFLKSIVECPRFVFLSPGMFSREPYPYHITVDFNGFFEESWLAISSSKELDSFAKKHGASAKCWPVDNYIDCTKPYFQFRLRNTIPAEVKRKIDLFEKNYCVPLQISDYFATSNEVTGNKQWDFLINVLNATPKNVGLVVTHYISPGLEEKIIQPDNINYLENSYPNLIYCTQLDETIYPSQIILDLVDGVITISSSVGLQAKILGKELITVGNSHLSPFSDGGLESISSEIKKCATKKPNFLRYLHGRYFLPTDLIFKNKASIELFLSKLQSKKPDAPPVFFDDRDLKKYYDKVSISQVRAAMQKIKNPFHEPSKFAATVINRIADAKYKVISFDLFDTLIQRDVFSPAAVFDLVEEKIKSSKFSDALLKLLRNTQSQSFKALRIKSEQAARTTVKTYNFEDCNLDEIYDEISKNTTNKEFINFLKKSEIDTEFEVIRPRIHGKILYQLAKTAGKRIIFCSDMYLPSELLKKILKKNEIYGGEKIYVSSETRLRKHSGNMFLHILDDLKIYPTEIYHLGDAVSGDYEVPRRYGISASLIPAARDYWRQTYGNSYKKSTPANITEELIFGGQAAYAYDFPYHATENAGYFRGRPEIFGYSVAGPLMLGLCEWLATSLRREKLEKIFFFSRDGFIVKRVFEATTSKKLNNITCEYVNVSRRVLSIAAITSHEDITILVKQRFEPMPLELFMQIRFGIDLWMLTHEEVFSLLKDTKILTIDDIVSTASHSEDLYKVAHRLKKEIFNSSAELREKVKNYFFEIGFFTKPLNNVGIFDVGYAGSLQKYIEKIAGANFIHGFYFATFTGVNDLLKNGGIATGYAGEYIDPISSDLRYVDALHIFETIFSNTEGTTFNYLRNEGKVIPIKTAEQEYLGKNYFFTKFWRGIDDFINTYNKYSSNIDFTQFNWQKSFLPFDDFVKNPKIDDLYILNDVNFENLYCGEKSTPIVSYEDRIQSVLWSHGQRTIANFSDNESLITIKHLRAAKNFESLKEYLQMLYEEQYIRALMDEHRNNTKEIEDELSELRTENAKLNMILNNFINESKKDPSIKLTPISYNESILTSVDRWFSEECYIQANPDVADAIRNGQFESGLQHFKMHGFKEERKLFP